MSLITTISHDRPIGEHLGDTGVAVDGALGATPSATASPRPGTPLTVTHAIRTLALALASPVVDLRITQVANETWGVHAVLPHGSIR